MKLREVCGGMPSRLGSTCRPHIGGGQHQQRQGTGAAASTSGRASIVTYGPVNMPLSLFGTGRSLLVRGRHSNLCPLATAWKPLQVSASSVKGKRDPPPGGRKPGGKPKESKLSSLVRRTPVLNRFYDGTLLMGDLVMLSATQISSERIAWETLPQLLAVVIGSWLFAAFVLEDYNGQPPTTDNWYISLLGAPFLAVVNSTLTWALSVTLMLAVFSGMVATNTLDSSPIMEGLATEDLSPQMEIIIALLITMACWRGIAAKLRY